MNDRIPHTESDLVLADVKAKPSGWPPASLDPDSGRAPHAASGTAVQQPKQQITSLYSFRGLPRVLGSWCTAGRLNMRCCATSRRCAHGDSKHHMGVTVRVRSGN